MKPFESSKARSLGCRLVTLILITPLGQAIAVSPESISPEETPPEIRRVDLPAVRLIAHGIESPATLTFDPKAPAQPIPAQDGGEILKSVPGFNLIRKGGTDGDPVYRGMAGSRLGILLDGENILGGCGHRMDPPTAYVFPAAYDKVTLIRGPQSVRFGPGHSAGTVLFEREATRFTEPGVEWISQVTVGSFGRNDQMFDAEAGDETIDLRVSGTRTEADDYKDGNGDRVHSAYQRWSAHANLGWNVNAHHRIELGGIVSDGEAAYADRSMDGASFDRQNLSLAWNYKNTQARIHSVEAKFYYNYVDHVMDNYSLRDFTPSMMMPFPTASNPDRETLGGRLEAGINFGETHLLRVGLDYQGNRHSSRSTANATSESIGDLSRERDAEFASFGLFTEIEGDLGLNGRWFSGLRLDLHRIEDPRDTVPLGMMGSANNPTVDETRRETLPSAFIRYEHNLTADLVLSVGLGHTQRIPDYWELFSKESGNSLSAFYTKPERTTQLDLGLVRSQGTFTYGLHLFANRIDDYILIESGVMKGMRSATVSRNIDAHTYGGEFTLSYELSDAWRVDASLAYVRGENLSDDRPLAQQPPLEGRLGLTYTAEKWSLGALLRMSARQNRIAINQGNIVGQDLGSSPSFAVFSLNGSWQLSPRNRLTAGVDNLFDAEYAEHLSRGGSQIAGFPAPSTRVNEPGRNFWLQWQFEY